MREIKFRYRLSSDSFPHIMKIISLEDFASGAVHLYSMDPDAYLAGQYTGIKDVNGKEIYEGDVVLLSHKYMDDPYSFKAKIIFEDGGFKFQSNVKGEPSYYLVQYTKRDWDTEVIGNIYENPELLNG